MSIEGGVLYVVATPIGNLGDITRRALEVLQQVDLIVAEDTRHSARLLSAFAIETPMMSVRDQNERRETPRLVARLTAGESVALISDSGTPLISDPGYHLVTKARESGVRVVPVPGPSALICALSVAGIPTARFVFEGFLPAGESARRRRLRELAHERRTLVFYEAPHRIEACLEDLASAFGPDRRASIARELTKAFESVQMGTLGGLLAATRASEVNRKGEFVVLVSGAPSSTVDAAIEAEEARVLRILLAELPLSQAVAVAARLTGTKKNRLYARAIALRHDAGPGAR